LRAIVIKCTHPACTFKAVNCEKNLIMTNRFTLLLSVFALISLTTTAQVQEYHLPLNLRSGEFKVALDDDRKLSQQEVERWPSFQGERYGLVALDQLPTIDQQAALEATGIRFLGYYPKGYYLLGIDESANLQGLNAFGLRAQTPHKAEYKSVVGAETAPNHATAKGGYLLNVSPYTHLALEQVASVLVSDGYEVLEQHPTYHSLTVAVSSEEAQELASHPAIEFIDWKFAEGEPENYTARTLHRTNYLGTRNNNALQFDGSGIKVALQDDGAIGPHIDHQGRTVHWWDISDGDHGDHVGGTIAGAGNINARNLGQAPGAELHVYKAWPEYQAYDSVSSHYNAYGVVITSTSYSDGCNAGYTTRTRTMDEQSYDYPSLLHVFSAGNSNGSNCGYGAGSNWGNITGGHKMGKNVIAVANVNEIGGIANSSSRGPAHDGRIKPDLSAKGVNVTSTIGGNSYDTYTGTSMACPGVSGTMAVLYQAYEDQNAALPNGGLMKAIAMNTADDLGTPGPDFIYGWGQINARRAYEVIDAGNYTEGNVAQAGQNTQTLNVPANTTRARFMVYWTDPEANVGAATALVNDLDMVVVTPSGDTILPYVLDETPNAATLGLPATHGEDHLNNVEQVEIINPVAGSYEVIINGYLVPQGPQAYFLTHSFEGKALHLTYPVGGEPLIPGVTEMIRWDAGDTTQTIDLEYSTDGGSSWQSIATGVNPEDAHYYWTVPFGLSSANVHVRLTQGPTQVTSNAFSVIGVPLGLEVEWACPDSIGLRWNNIASAGSYVVYKLGQKYMDSIGVAGSNSFVDYGVSPNDPNVWYSVSSIGNDGARGERALAINKAPGVFNCVLDIDAEVVTMIPDASSLFDCHGAERQPGFVIKNNGSSPLLTFDAELYFSATGLLTTESFTANVAPGATDTFYFADSILLDGGGVNSHFVIVDLSNDQNHWNDTASMTYRVVTGELQEPVFAEDFDLMPICPSTDDCGGTVCNILNDWVNETNGVGDDIDWRLSVGSTPTNLSGPNGDYTNNGFGRYLYLEASGECSFQTAELISPCIDLTASPSAVLQFYYHMYGSDMGELHVDVFDGDAWYLDVMTPISGNQGQEWEEQLVPLDAFAGKIVNVRFRGITGPSFNSDLAIDGVSIYQPPVANFDYAYDSPNNLTINFTDLSLYADDMSFDLGDGNVFSTVPASHTYASLSSYTVTQTVSNDYGEDTYSVEINALSVEELDGMGVQIYPNPAVDQVMIELTETGSLEAWKIYGMNGERILEGTILGTSERIDVSMLSKGVYMMELQGAELMQVRLVVQ
jgi:hypothetical protein